MAVDLTTGSYDKAGVFSKHIQTCDVELSQKIETDENLPILKNFTMTKVLKENSAAKSIVVEGKFEGDDRSAIIVVEKIPFDTRDLSQLLTSESRLELKFWNNIYGNYHVLFSNGFNGIAVQVIHPATEKDYEKFLDVPEVMVTETKELYEKIVAPYFRQQVKVNSFDNCDKSKVIFSDSPEKPCLILLQEELEKCACTNPHFRAKAFLPQEDLLSLRDLNSSSIHLLQKLQKKCLEELSGKYGVPAAKIESYITYPPAGHPFHVVFETVEKDSPIPAEKAHALETVVSNLRLIPDYYQRATLTYSLPEKDLLLKSITEMKNDNCTS